MLNAELIVNEAYLKRVPTVIDRSNGIQAWDVDNLYPQRAEEVKNRSFTTKTATERLAGFVFGGGFTDSLLSSLVVNGDGHTMNDILDFLTQDESVHNAYALHFNYNLNYQIKSIKAVELKFCRFGMPDKWGRVFEIKMNNNWEHDPYKSVNYGWDVYTYPVFNPNPEIVKQQIQAAGGIQNYPGQILLWTPKQFVYPLATFDPVFDHAQIQADLAVFDVSLVQNSFASGNLFKYPGTFDSKEEEDKFTSKLNKFKGPRAAGSTMVVEAPLGLEAKNLIESLQLPNIDKLHPETFKTAKQSIRESFSMPPEVMGEVPQAGMFNKQSIQEAYEFYNTITEPRRLRVSRMVQKIMPYWWQQLTIGTYGITPKKYGQSSNNQG